MSLNKVQLIGLTGKDPEVREANGTKVASFTLATSERYKDKNGDYQTNTEWHNIVAWRGTAEVVEKYIHKGMQIYVEGKIKTRSWDKDGEKRYVTEIIADSIQMLGKKEESQQSAPQQRQQYQTSPLVDGVVEPEDGDLPF